MAGRIASEVVATETLAKLRIDTATAAPIASTATNARITSSTAIDSHAVSSVPPTEYHGRKSEISSTTPVVAATQSPRLRRRSSTRRRLTRYGLTVLARLEVGRLHGVDQQHRDRHRPHSARNGGDRRR